MQRILQRLLTNRSGNFGMMLAILMLPMAIGMGAAFDYSYALSVKQQLQNAADSAAVSALAEQSVGVIAALKSGTTGEVAIANKDAEAWFKANLDPKFAGYLVSYGVSVKLNSNAFTSEVKFSAKVPTSFLNIINKSSIDVAGIAQGSYIPATYIDFYLMLDNSPSMGLGATTSDIAKLEKANGCALACHSTSTNITNTYATAAKLGATTRFEVVRKAAGAMMTTAASTRKYSDQYRMAVYSMGPTFTAAALTNVAALSQDLTGVAQDTAKMELMSVYDHATPGTQTNMLGNLTSLQKVVGTGGSGMNSGDRQKVLFLVSDGVEDANRPSGCLKPLYNDTKNNQKRCQQPLDTSICKTIKDAGVRIAVLYTTYYPITSDSWYNTWIKPFQSEIATNMKACASSDLYFEVSPTQGIDEAMNALFLKVVNLPRLTM